MYVLVADDEPVSRRLIESSLRRWGYDVILAEDGFAASKILLSPDAPKLAILDWMMPGFDGVQLCQDIRRNKPEPYTYILLLTSKRAQEDIIAGLEAGADDYVGKPFDPAELKVRLRTGKRILILQDQLITAREALRDRATRDQLTGLWNRAAVLDILANEVGRAARENASVSVVMADLDKFKAINDAHGHLVGDEVLRHVSAALGGAVRQYDAVGRYGGEEFLVVLPGCNACNAFSHAERLRAAVARCNIQVPGGTLSLTISLGVACFERNAGIGALELLEAADAALYRAKQNGRNRVEIASGAESLCT